MQTAQITTISPELETLESLEKLKFHDKKLRIAINGFGRIGRAAFKIALARPNIEVVAINDLSPAEVLAHLLKYDSVYGIYQNEVTVKEAGKIEYLVVKNQKTKILSQKDPEKLPWKDLGVQVVLECTGRFTDNDSANAHIKAGAEKVIISAPPKTESAINTYLLGVNIDSYKGEPVISNASCTTNCVSPVAKVIEKYFGVEKAGMTTIHAVTAEQNLVDGAPPSLHKDLRRGRSALNNIVPATTGAATATTKVIPQLKDKFDGMAVRVPIICGSLTDFTFVVKKETNVEEVKQAFLEAKKDKMFLKVIQTSTEPLVSSDIIKNPASAIIDLTLIKVIDKTLVKVLAWYDNEWGYSNRLIDLAWKISSFDKATI